MRKYRRGVFIATYARTKKGIEYLILKRKLHWIGWEFPKGGVEKDESCIQCVKKELFEETGKKPLKIIDLNVNGKYNYQKKLKDRPNVVGQTYKLYAAEIEKGKIILDKTEHSNYKWLDFKKTIKKLTWENQRKCLRMVNNQLNKL